ncbi:PREDICTED: uncharacterized protein LOC104594084 [Nelumbo nucifera]|uniref:Uncharacterized protein LOC104594084 n=2 Tax=Nelumbo nucifera TaxID=4432 RepID=A0A1U7ZLB5_NELNU|nr:PREDICTED: uncharacterized protein LOC104594084 [Nelumbo nucifera]DAD23469.1 TPA_asm: hypothetical protein HUJ06_024932 [Nelumbo nucifera]
MAYRHLLVSTSCFRSLAVKPLLLTPSQSSLYTPIKRYSDKESLGEEIIEKARSTAEEFTRVAKEKAEAAIETVKETFEDAKEAVMGESDDSDSAKKKYKKVEKGNCHKMGKH